MLITDATAIPECPKIDTLYDRDPVTFKVDHTNIRRPEFESVKCWRVTEKIDGTNVRVVLTEDNHVLFGGRTDNAQMPPKLMSALHKMFPVDLLMDALPQRGERPRIVLYGEGYGAGIQKGGIYRPDPSFRLFDVMVGNWWLEWDDVCDVAEKLGIKTVPRLAENCSLRTACELVHASSQTSWLEGGTVGSHVQQEGVVATSIPMLFNRKGDRVMWKLKVKDFANQ